MYKWTVNWRFVDETTFLSPLFAIGLLGVHAALLVLFLTTKWIKPSHRSFASFLGLIWSPPHEDSYEAGEMSLRVSPRFILTSLLTANTQAHAVAKGFE